MPSFLRQCGSITKYTLVEPLEEVAIIGVLVAISIPIFTAQLKKARLATNQANARAAYATAVALEITKDAKTDAAGGTYTYTVSSATAEETGTAVSGNADISAWTVTTAAGVTVGDQVATTWVITIDANGAITGISGN